MAAIEIRRITAAELALAQAIRCEVFVAEQGVSEALELDGLDAAARHLLARAGGEAIGTARLRLLEDGRLAKIERVAVRRAWRGHGAGLALVEAALAWATELGVAEAKLHAQTVVEAFYRRLGFSAYGPVFEEDGIPHIAMRRRLPAPDAGCEPQPKHHRPQPAQD